MSLHPRRVAARRWAAKIRRRRTCRRSRLPSLLRRRHHRLDRGQRSVPVFTYRWRNRSVARAACPPTIPIADWRRRDSWERSHPFRPPVGGSRMTTIADPTAPAPLSHEDAVTVSRDPDDGRQLLMGGRTSSRICRRRRGRTARPVRAAGARRSKLERKSRFRKRRSIRCRRSDQLVIPRVSGANFETAQDVARQPDDSRVDGRFRLLWRAPGIEDRNSPNSSPGSIRPGSYFACR